mgnify:CR=1 FL=1
MTKLFSEYLTESKRVFEFKVKIAGELPEGFKKKVKMALAKYEATKISAVKKTVVQEHPLDFPKLQNKEVHIFDISLNYPVTADVLMNYMCEYFNMNPEMLKVKNPNDPTETYLAPTNVKQEYAPILTTPEYEKPAVPQEKLTGDKYNQSMLKSLMDEISKSRENHPVSFEKDSGERDSGEFKTEVNTKSPIMDAGNEQLQ